MLKYPKLNKLGEPGMGENETEESNGQVKISLGELIEPSHAKRDAEKGYAL